MYSEDLRRAKKVLNNLCTEFNGDKSTIHYQINKRIVDNFLNSNDFVTILWSEYNSMFKS